MSDQRKQYEFTGDLYRGPRGGYYIDFPYDAYLEFGTRKQVKVKIWFDGHFVRKSLLPKGNGEYWLSVSMDVRTVIGKGDGDKVQVVVEQDLESRNVEIPEELDWLLENEPDMKEVFLRHSYHTRKFFCDWVNGASGPDTRVNRINRIFDWLRRHQSGRILGRINKEEMEK